MYTVEPLITKNLQFSHFISDLITKPVSEKLYPSITISRDPGSGGKDVARKVADKLGIKCYDHKELVGLIAKYAKANPKLINEALDERTVSPVESMVNNFLGIRNLPEQAFIKSLVAVSFEISSQAPSVFLGRGINFILPKMSDLRIRITAPRKVLVNYAMKYEGHSAGKARETIDEFIKLRKDFVYKYFNKDITKAHYYDLVINTEYFSIDDAVSLTVAAFKRKFNILD